MVEGSVLVLNRSWVAIHIAPAKRALSLLCQGVARAVHPSDFSVFDFEDWCELSQFWEEGRFVHTPSLRIRIPEVIQLCVYNGFVRKEVRFSRRNIFERDQNTCQYCAKRFPKPDLTIDHVVPQSRGGRDTWENLVLACVPCNVRKGNRTPREAGMLLVNKPVKPNWLPKFGLRTHAGQLSCWQRFVDTAYWDVELKE